MHKNRLQNFQSLPPLMVGQGALKSFNKWIQKQKGLHVVILCDSHTLEHCWPILLQQVPALSEAALIETEPGEASKSLEIAAYIWQTLAEHQTTRYSVLVNLGGGVITDLGGFCASVYKRGIPFIHIPTSLLGMADASIGAKTGIDFLGVKNILGSFANPVSVVVDPIFLNTLPAREKLCGEAEIYKIAAIANVALWRQLKKNGFSIPCLEKAIATKLKIVQKDPLENNIRQSLNFGHTIGHAIESDSQGKLLHGEAIVIGMYIETELAYQLNYITHEWAIEIQQVLMWRFGDVLQPIKADNLWHWMGHDKKNKGHKIVFALPALPGKCHLNITCTPAQITKAIAAYNKCVK